jgi:uncharacterized protein (DUF1501 family)
MTLNRRQFLRKTGITAVGLSFSSPLLSNLAPAGPRRGAAGAARAGTDKVLVTINLFGGNDGLNTIVPLSQYDLYSDLRPRLAIAREQLLVLPNAPDFAFNPAMTALRDLYAQGKVAVINGVGVPPDAQGLFDHEAAQYEFQSGDILHTSFTSGPTGWVGRYLDSVGEGLVAPGIDFGGGRLLVTGQAREPLTIESIEQFQIQPSFDTEARLASYQRIMNIPNTESGAAERNRQVRQNALEQSAIVRDRTAGYVPAVEYPNLEENYLAYSLLQSAQLITADLGVRALSVGHDGYDTHSGQNDGGGNGEPGYHDYLLNTVSEAVAAFYGDLAAHGVADRVVTLIFSEFGRRPEENNDQGTDHGYGSVGFVIGGGVQGGVYGEYPSLAEDRLVLDGNVDVTVDFRSVYATVLARFMGADPAPVLGADFPLLGFM